MGKGRRSLFLKALLLLFGARIALVFFPLSFLQRALSRISPPSRSVPQPPFSLEEFSWAVSAASRYVPGARCLPQALAAQVLLQAHGFPVDFRIGVAKESQGAFQSHAWVESGGKIITGSMDTDRYTVLLRFSR